MILNKKHFREDYIKARKYKEEKITKKLKKNKNKVILSTKCSILSDEQNKAKRNEESPKSNKNKCINSYGIKPISPLISSNLYNKTISKSPISLKISQKIFEKESKAEVPQKCFSDKIDFKYIKKRKGKKIKDISRKHRWGYEKKDYIYYGNGKNKQIHKNEFLIKIPLVRNS